MAGIIFGLDIGTTKVCAIVGEVRDGQLQVIGLGIEPARGMRKGMVVDVNDASIAIARAVEKAEQSSGYELTQALVSMAGEHLKSSNSAGVVTIARSTNGVTKDDIGKALETAQTVAVPAERETVHVVPRRYQIDDHAGIISPIGMFGNRMEVEAHIITASAAALKSLESVSRNVGIKTEEFVLNVLASAEAVLDPAEREMGVIVADIGGGTTDIGLFTEGTVWHTDVIALGGFHFSNDIAIGLRVPYDIADEIKVKHGNCRPDDLDPEHTFKVKPFSGEQIEVGYRDLAEVIEARAEELFDMILASVKQSGYEGLLPAGIVLTGGTAQLRNLTYIAEKIMGVPARVAKPRNLVGLVDRLQSPAYSTAVGLLRWGISDYNTFRPNRTEVPSTGGRLKELLGRLLPG
jgi:cell division protein FtsA